MNSKNYYFMYFKFESIPERIINKMRGVFFSITIMSIHFPYFNSLSSVSTASFFKTKEFDRKKNAKLWIFQMIPSFIRSRFMFIFSEENILLLSLLFF